jgi:hypothetical protein
MTNGGYQGEVAEMAETAGENESKVMEIPKFSCSYGYISHETN